jgi:hypothetical protein
MRVITTYAVVKKSTYVTTLIGTAAAEFLFWKYKFRIFGIISLQCISEYKNKENVVAGLEAAEPDDPGHCAGGRAGGRHRRHPAAGPTRTQGRTDTGL